MDYPLLIITFSINANIINYLNMNISSQVYDMAMKTYMIAGHTIPYRHKGKQNTKYNE